jgi:hypothetical protein
MGFEEFDMGNDNKYTSKNMRYKGREGETDRLSFVWFEGTVDGSPDLETAPKFIGAQRLYHPEVGYVIDDGPEFNKISVATGGRPSKLAVATVVVQWPTDRNGQIEKSRLSKGDFSVLPWIFSKDKYQSLKKTHSKFHFGAHDISVDCSDGQYQKMTFTPERDNLLSLFLKKNPEMAEKVLAQTQEVINGIRRSIAQELTLDEFKERLGRGESKPDSFEGMNVSESDITDVMDDILG